MSSTRVAIAETVKDMLSAASALSTSVSVERVWNTQKSINDLKAFTVPLLTVVAVDQADERDSRSTFNEQYTIDVAIRKLIPDQDPATVDPLDLLGQDIARLFRSHRLTNRSEVFAGSEYITLVDTPQLNLLVFVGIVRLTFAKAGVA